MKIDDIIRRIQNCKYYLWDNTELVVELGMLQHRFRELKEVGLTEIPSEVIRNIEKEWEDMSRYMRESPLLEQSKICRAIRDSHKIVLEEIENVR